MAKTTTPTAAQTDTQKIKKLQDDLMLADANASLHEARMRFAEAKVRTLKANNELKKLRNSK